MSINCKDWYQAFKELLFEFHLMFKDPVLTEEARKKKALKDSAFIEGIITFKNSVWHVKWALSGTDLYKIDPFGEPAEKERSGIANEAQAVLYLASVKYYSELKLINK